MYATRRRYYTPSQVLWSIDVLRFSLLLYSSVEIALFRRTNRVFQSHRNWPWDFRDNILGFCALFVYRHKISNRRQKYADCITFKYSQCTQRIFVYVLVVILCLLTITKRTKTPAIISRMHDDVAGGTAMPRMTA